MHHVAPRTAALPAAGLLAFGLAAGTANAGGVEPQLIEVDLSGLSSVDSSGSPLNDVIDVDLAALGLDRITAVGWDVTIDTVGESWLSEVTLGLGDADAMGEVFLTPGIGNDEPGTGARFFTDVNDDDLFDPADDLIDLSLAGFDPIIATSGTLRIEIFEAFDDVIGEADASFAPGSTLYLQAIPGPGAIALLAGAGLAGTRRRRA